MDSQEDSSIQEELLRLLSTEIARDGGSSQATLLKEYFGVKKNDVDAMLLQSTGSKKLLPFLEKFPDIFLVDRQGSTHTVKLMKRDYCRTIQRGDVQERELRFRETATGLLRKRNCRLRRRNNKTKDNGAVPVQWLIQNCKLQVHHWLRAKCYYLTQPSCFFGGIEWNHQVESEVVGFLLGFMEVNVSDACVALHHEDNIFDLETFIFNLVRLVQDDGATQISWSLLLFRNPQLKRLLGGEDFITVARENPEKFHQFETLSVGQDGDITLKLRTRQDQRSSKARMLVDEVGLYSVTAARWATAMARTLYHLVDDDSNHTVVDLTAGVGGLTVALAKTFQHVVAVELDHNRHQLCRSNLERHRVADRVQLVCGDAIDTIPKLQSRVPLVIDPPWGGEDYRSCSSTDIRLGYWTLAEVLRTISNHLSGATVGLKLPLRFDVQGLCDELGPTICVLATRKLGPQLFVVLRITGCS